eukprot:TRINITY_DN8457_c0_g1_i1.p1 TRINITY_DN8457_c0_g1~~TRINITY_DN8457_c0_g1_i1.p1  ORF type:complete len:734 (+),score=263.65 TRINITY_DN8457_c0_g1_i1:64-2265(+)
MDELKSRYGLVVSPEFAATIPNDVPVEQLKQNLLNLSLKNFAAPVLPSNIGDDVNMVLDGPILAQIISVTQISPDSQMNICKLSDGFSRVLGVELEKTCLSPTKTATGTKVLLQGKIIVRRGKVLLTNKCISILGGRVETLFTAWRANQLKKVEKHSTPDAPPFIQFSTEGLAQGTHMVRKARLEASNEAQLASKRTVFRDVGIIPAVIDVGQKQNKASSAQQKMMAQKREEAEEKFQKKQDEKRAKQKLYRERKEQQRLERQGGGMMGASDSHMPMTLGAVVKATGVSGTKGRESTQPITFGAPKKKIIKSITEAKTLKEATVDFTILELSLSPAIEGESSFTQQLMLKVQDSTGGVHELPTSTFLQRDMIGIAVGDMKASQAELNDRLAIAVGEYTEKKWSGELKPAFGQDLSAPSIFRLNKYVPPVEAKPVIPVQSNVPQMNAMMNEMSVAATYDDKPTTREYHRDDNRDDYKKGRRGGGRDSSRHDGGRGDKRRGKHGQHQTQQHQPHRNDRNDRNDNRRGNSSGDNKQRGPKHDNRGDGKKFEKKSQKPQTSNSETYKPPHKQREKQQKNKKPQSQKSDNNESHRGNRGGYQSSSPGIRTITFGKAAPSTEVVFQMGSPATSSLTASAPVFIPSGMVPPPIPAQENTRDAGRSNQKRGGKSRGGGGTKRNRGGGTRKTRDDSSTSKPTPATPAVSAANRGGKNSGRGRGRGRGRGGNRGRGRGRGRGK